MTALAGEAACCRPSTVRGGDEHPHLGAGRAGGWGVGGCGRAGDVGPAAASVSDACHWYVYVIGPTPVQVPFAAVKTLPSLAVPDKLGATVFAGGVAAKALEAFRAKTIATRNSTNTAA